MKLLLFQQWYGLLDPGLEEAVDDRLSFRRFARLPLDEGVPDHSTIWRFRQELERHDLSEVLFAEINRQLDVTPSARRVLAEVRPAIRSFWGVKGLIL